MISWTLAHAEWVALTLNVTICLACIARGDLPKTVYWAGAALVVGGVIMMKGVG